MASAHFFTPFLWRHVKHRAEGAGEGGVVAEAAAIADVRDGFFAREQMARGEQPLARDVLVDAVACFLLEFAGEVNRVNIKLVCKELQAEVSCQIVIDIGDDI